MTQTRCPANSPDKDTELAQTYDALSGIEHDTASGAIGLTHGTGILDGAAALAMTLAAPTAGTQETGGNDGQELTIISKTAHAHTVTTPANAINGGKHILTFANEGDCVVLVAYGGVWFTAQLLSITAAAILS